MEPTEIEHATHSFKAPPDWDEKRAGECATLPVRATSVEGAVVLQSAWQPSADELRRLNEGKPVILTVWGYAHPVIAVGVRE